MLICFHEQVAEHSLNDGTEGNLSVPSARSRKKNNEREFRWEGWKFSLTGHRGTVFMNKRGDIMWDSSSSVKLKNLTGIEKVFAERKNPFHKGIEPHRFMFMKKRELNLQMQFSTDKLQTAIWLTDKWRSRLRMFALQKNGNKYRKQ